VAPKRIGLSRHIETGEVEFLGQAVLGDVMAQSLTLRRAVTAISASAARSVLQNRPTTVAPRGCPRGTVYWTTRICSLMDRSCFTHKRDVAPDRPAAGLVAPDAA
jgi:hypothetical protein